MLFLSKLRSNLFFYKIYNDIFVKIHIFIKYFLFKITISLKLKNKFKDEN